MVSKVILGIIAIVILFLFFPMVQTSVGTFRSDEFTETEPGLTTGAVATANFTLDQALFDADINNVVSISSNLTEPATITPTGYTASTKNLQVTGLKQSDTRSLTLVYKVNALESDTPLNTFAPFFLFFFILGGIGLVLKLFWNKGR